MLIFTYESIRFILSILITIILLWIIIRFRAKKNTKKSSLDILQERLVKGEITEDEYEQARRMQEK